MIRGHDSRLLLRGTVLAIALTSTAQGLAYVLQVLIARMIGPTEFGYFSYAMAWLSIGLIVGKRGYDTGVVRFVGEYKDRQDFPALIGAVRHARWVTVITAVCVGCAGAAWLVLLRDGMARDLAVALLLTTALLPLCVCSEIMASAVRGLSIVGPALAGDGILRPLIVILAAFALVASGYEPLTSAEILAAYGVGTVVSIALTGSVWARRASALADSVDFADRRRWSATAPALMLANGFLVVLYAVDTLMLGWLANTTLAGHYSVASKLALLVLFAMNAAQVLAGPMLSGASAAGRREELERIVQAVNKVSVLAALPIVLGLFLFGADILRLFGPGFDEVNACLRILVAMQLLNVLTGPSGLLLSMAGHQRLLALLLAVGLVANVLLNLVLIPALGATGAAISALVAHTLWNLLALVGVRTRMGIDCSILTILPFRRTSAR